MPDVFVDREGRQKHKFKPGVYNLAVKAVDNEGLEGMETLKIKINGKIETLSQPKTPPTYDAESE